MSKYLLPVISLLVVLAMVLAACTTTQPTTTTSTTAQSTSPGTTTTAQSTTATTTTPTSTTTASNMVIDPSTGELVEMPRYGGVITYAATSDTPALDPYDPLTNAAYTYVLEKLAMFDWATPKSKFTFVPNYIPIDVYKAHLATGWEVPDPLTFIIHIRQGVHWQNLPPMNGRLMTAADVVFSYNRGLGLGDGFTKPSPASAYLTKAGIVSVKATDQYTVEVKINKFNLDTLANFLCEDNAVSWVEPPEVIKQYGNLSNWKNIIGTGPFIISDHVQDSSWTFTKNPDYWCYDEKYPNNKLPYADLVRVLVIPDASTRLAALRAGKIETVGVSSSEAQTLMKTNPELVLTTSTGNNGLIPFVISKAPFTDIRVRQAMQMALDLPTILRTFYQGYGDSTPYLTIGPGVPGYYTPYSEWPDELKAEYAYNLEGAKQLLADAGYPSGFETTWDVVPEFSTLAADPDLAVLLQDYWSKIGVKVNLKQVGIGPYFGQIFSKSVDPMGTFSGAWALAPVSILQIFYYSKSAYNPFVVDPIYDAMVEKAATATTRDEQKSLVIACEDYAIRQHWAVVLNRPASFSFRQPWFKGWNGEGSFGGGQYGALFARVWVDTSLKMDKGK